MGIEYIYDFKIINEILINNFIIEGYKKSVLL